MIVLPEIVLQETIEAAINFVREDYRNAQDKTKSYLYLCLQNSKIDNYSFFEQAVSVICNEEDDPRYLIVDLAFNRNQDRLPAIHITLPSESTTSGNGIGTDEGYAEPVYEDFDPNPVGQPSNENEDRYRAVYTRTLASTYSIVIMSDNSNEVVLLYHFVRALIIALIPHFHQKGLMNINFGGNDVQPYAEWDLHMRSINLNLQYETKVPSIFPSQLIRKVEVVGTPTEE